MLARYRNRALIFSNEDRQDNRINASEWVLREGEGFTERGLVAGSVVTGRGRLGTSGLEQGWPTFFHPRPTRWAFGPAEAQLSEIFQKLSDVL